MCVTRKLAAILYADVAGYSRLTGVDEIGTHIQLSTSLDLIATRIEEADGRVVHYAGDAVLAEFPSAVSAVETALAIQRALTEMGAKINADKRLQYRIAVNLGEVIVDRDAVYGDGVNIAARLESLVPTGGICVSEDVHRQVKGKIAARFQDMGEQNLKNIAEKVRAYSVNPGIGGHSKEGPDQAFSRPHTPSDMPSIGVLPFQNLSTDPKQEFFANGVAVDLISGLSRIRSLRVAAQNSSFTFDAGNTDPREVAEALGVRYVLEGSVQRAGTRIRVTVQLIDADSATQIWSERFDHELEDVFEIQDEITEAILAALYSEITTAEAERTRPSRPADLDAWALYHRGWQHMFRYSREDNHEARALFAKAIELNPSFGPAYFGRGYANTMTNHNTEAVADLAEAIWRGPRHPNLWAFQCVSAWANTLKSDHVSAYEMAVTADRQPNSSFWGSATLAVTLANLGRGDEARFAFDRTMVEKPDFTETYIKLTLPFETDEIRHAKFGRLRQLEIPE